MFRVLPVAVGVAAAALAFAAPATAEPAAAEPCTSGMDSLEYALEAATGIAPLRPVPTYPCECGGARDGPCQCWVYCFCLPDLKGGDPGGFIDCSRDLLRINCPGAPLDRL